MNATKTRTLRTPAERAIAALGVEQRRVEKLEAKWDALEAQRTALGVIGALTVEGRAMSSYLDARRQLAGHDDLPETTEESSR